MTKNEWPVAELFLILLILPVWFYVAPPAAAKTRRVKPQPPAAAVEAARPQPPPNVSPKTTAAWPVWSKEESFPSFPPPGIELPDVLNELTRRRLLIPVRGIEPDDLYDSFHDPRGSRGSRRHHAIDIMAPRYTPILAADSGEIARLSSSKAGGLSIYQFGPSGHFVYFYAHLQAYEKDLHEGLQVRKGDLLGYVGTSGNAPEQTPHLHFEINRLRGVRDWWRGTPVNPFEVLHVD